MGNISLQTMTQTNFIISTRVDWLWSLRRPNSRPSKLTSSIMRSCNAIFSHKKKNNFCKNVQRIWETFHCKQWLKQISLFPLGLIDFKVWGGRTRDPQSWSQASWEALMLYFLTKRKIFLQKCTTNMGNISLQTMTQTNFSKFHYFH